jgi:hypothetical protein
MRRILFTRKIRKVSGGQIKVRDYFDHCLAHPDVEPFIWFGPGSDRTARSLWADVEGGRLVSDRDALAFDAAFVAGRDWRWLSGKGLPQVINLVQHVKHADADDPRFPYLQRPALRICVSEAVREAISPHAAGEVTTVPAGVPLDLFRATGTREPGAVLVLATKQPKFGRRLTQALRAEGTPITLLDEPVARRDFATMLQRAEVFVGLPNEREGLYLPGIEALAAGACLVCADAAGNSGYCIDGESALVPAAGDLDEHVQAVRKLLSDRGLRDSLRRRGRAIAEAHSLEAERDAFFGVLAKLWPELRTSKAAPERVAG